MQKFDNWLHDFVCDAGDLSRAIIDQYGGKCRLAIKRFLKSESAKRISYIMGGLITAVIGILMMPWELMSSASAYIFTWLIGYSGLMGAIGGIMIADYFVIARKEFEFRRTVQNRRNLFIFEGFNWRAIVALVVAILPVVPGFLRAATTPGGVVANPTILDSLYTYAWFVTFGIAFMLYFILMRPAFGRGRELKF